MSELSPQAEFVASLLATPPTVEHEGLAMRLTQVGVLRGVAGSLFLDQASPALLGIAPQLLSITALQTMQHNPLGRQEYARRFQEATSSLEGHWLNNSSGIEGGELSSAAAQRALDGLVERHNAAHGEVMANAAAASAGDAARVAAMRSNVSSILQNSQTDFQRNGGFPGGNAA